MIKKDKKIIGRVESVDFPELGLFAIEAKVDTGAYSSSIHCKDVSIFRRDGLDYVSFVLLGPNHPQFDNNPIVWPFYHMKKVKNSFGHVEERFVIKTKLQIYDEYFEIELSLADRSLMDYPVLLGRKVLKRKFLVDVSKINCSRKQKARKKK